MKVLILSTDFMDMANSYVDSFKRLGAQCNLLIHQEVKKSETKTSQILNYVKRKNPNYLKSEILNSIDSFSEIVRKWCDDNHPDLVLDLLGANLNAESVKEIGKHSYIIKYMLDLIENYFALKDTIKYYSHVFTYETYDIPNLKRFGAKKVDLLYATYDSNKYYASASPKMYDIAFVGKMFTKEQSKRYEMLRRLTKEHPEYKYAIYGVATKPFQPYRYLKWLIFDHGKYFKNRNISWKEVNTIYSQSKICLNINSYQTYDTWSSRILEMMACGTLVLTDSSRDIHLFLGDGVVEYDSYEELVERIKYYLERDKERKLVSDKGLIIAQEYTMNHTVMQIMNYCESYFNS